MVWKKKKNMKITMWFLSSISQRKFTFTSSMVSSFITYKPFKCLICKTQQPERKLSFLTFSRNVLGWEEKKYKSILCLPVWKHFFKFECTYTRTHISHLDRLMLCHDEVIQTYWCRYSSRAKMWRQREVHVHLKHFLNYQHWIWVGMFEIPAHFKHLTLFWWLQRG